MDIHEIAGVAGFLAYMGSYSLLQLGRISGDGILYSAMNLTAALLIMVSLSGSFNLGSALVQTAWISLSVLGICRTLHNRTNKKTDKQRSKRRNSSPMSSKTSTGNHKVQRRSGSTEQSRTELSNSNTHTFRPRPATT